MHRAIKDLVSALLGSQPLFKLSLPVLTKWFCCLGFVRFVSPRSVQRALERFRISEIEVQDVSVMIKSLKSDAPPV